VAKNHAGSVNHVSDSVEQWEIKMQTKWLSTNEEYSGEQLHSLFAYLNHGVLGDSVVSWVGPCSVSFDHMVDGEDLLAQAKIQGSKMLHFIVEKFEISLFCGVSLQRLFASMALDLIFEMADEKTRLKSLNRSGDDIYYDDAKLSISIATQSPVSTLIHFALNVSNFGTPVKTCSLEDFQIEPKEFADTLMHRFANEVRDMINASHKVKWVR
jgi:hypothetical protein